jgi:hypothetical protein
MFALDDERGWVEVTDEMLGRSKPIEKPFESAAELLIKWVVLAVVAVEATAVVAVATVEAPWG